ncbi:MAG: Ig-like domain-containing protein [Verrucomicrobiota bacterium]
MHRLSSLLAAFSFLLVMPPGHAQTTEFGGITVVQINEENTDASVTLTKTPGSSPYLAITGGNRGDYGLDFGAGVDPLSGVLIPYVAQLSRDNTAQGDTVGRFFATAAIGPNDGLSDYTIALFSAPAGDEVNMDVTFGFFPYNKWIGGIARNAANNGELTELSGSSALVLNTHFTDLATPAGQYTLNINTLTGNNAAQNGILLVTGARNEDNFALSQANANGSFTIYCHDNGVDGAGYENDGVGFVYLPTTKVGTDHLTAIGRVNNNASLDVSAKIPGKTVTVTKGATGIWYLQISGESPATGTMLVSPEGGVGNTTDNIVSCGWEEAGSRWVIETRDLPGATPGLQNATAAADDVFSFAFFTAPVLPAVTLTSPAPGSAGTAPAGVTLEATATDADGSITQVEFLRNGLVIATDATAPYSFEDSNLRAGHHDYQARATDNEGNVTTTAVSQVQVTLVPASIPANTALSFDGTNDYVTMGAAPTLNVGQMSDTGFTLECWFSREGAGRISGSGSGGVNGAPLFGKGRGESDGTNVDCNIFFGINAEGRLVADFEAQPATGVAAGENFPITATHAPLTNSAWHHAAVTYDHATSTWKMYLDGTLAGSTTVTANARPRFDSIQHFAIGTALNSTGVADGAFRGRIDEARVWNYARSATQISASKDQPVSTAPGLIGRFGLNEGTGTSTASSAGSHAGTLTNGPLWVEGVPFGATNTAPTVVLTSPASVSSSAVSAPVTLEATAADADGVVINVEFLVDGLKVGEDSTSPYSFTWTPPAVGNYTLRARAQDDLGGTRESDPTTLYVMPTGNHPAVALKSPADGGSVTGSTANLQAEVFDANGDAMTVTFYGRPTVPATPGPDFRIVQIPDTQFYSEGAAGHADTISVQQLIATFGAQTQWVVENRQARNIAFVSHMGDIVQKGNNGGNNIEWTRASAAMAKLENPITSLLAHGVPFGVAPGNHDISPIGDYDDGSTSFYNQFFGTSRFAKRSYWGGNYGSDNTNNYQLFSASGLDFIAIHFAYDTTPNAAILNWADALLKAHPHRRAIATSHSIIGGGNPASFSAQGRGIYDALKNNPNFFLMLCGHIHAEGRRADVFQGRTVYSVLSDYQGATNGGNGFLRTLTFSPASNSIKLESYSPTLDRAVNTSDSIPSWENTVNLPYNMQTPVMGWVPLGTVSVAAGGRSAALNWTGLEDGKNYEWYAAASDGSLTSSSAARRFTRAPNAAPTITLTTPAHQAVFGTPVTIDMTATAADADGSIQRVEFYRDGTKLGEDSSAPYSHAWANATVGTHNIVAVAVDNDKAATLSNIAKITVVVGDEPPVIAITAPANGTALPAPASITLTANATDAEGPVDKVEFFSGSTSVGVDAQAPFTRSVTNLAPGTYTFTAKVTDSIGRVVTSDPVIVSVFVEAAAPTDVSKRSAGLFDPPAWTVAATSPAPYHFNLPGSNDGDVALKIAGANVPFNGGITLATNWNSPASIAGNVDAYDNLSLPFAGADGNANISVLDNTNNNASDDNPATSEQTSGVSVAYLPYSAGWTGASVNAAGAVTSGNLPAGVTVSKLGEAGFYSINGLSTAGNLLAVPNGNGGTSGDNVCSVRIEDGRWVVDVRDNGASEQDGDFSFVYIPPTTTGVFAAAVSSTGAVSQRNAGLSAFGTLTATPGAEGLDLQFGDGSVINPATAALFVTADATRATNALDNLVAWSVNGSKFRVFTQDLPQVSGTHQAIDLRILVIPLAPPVSQPANTVTISAPDASAGEHGGDGSLSFMLTRTGSTAEALTVLLAAAGSATPGADYSGFSSSLVMPAGQPSASLPLTVLADDIAEGSETVQISISSDATYSLGTTATASASIADHPAQGWSFANISHPDKRSPSADADGDGLSNLLEYFMGTPPEDANKAGETSVLTTETSAVFTFRRALNREDVTGDVEWSTDLIQWFRGGQSNGTVTLNIQVTTASLPMDDPQVMRGTATVAGGGPLPEKLFFRLSVTE